MKKRFLSLLCVLALCLGLLPVTALAAENDRPYSLYVGNTDVAKTEYSDNAAYWTSSDGGTNWTSQLDEPTADSYIHYDGNGTLTLHNVNISRSNENGIYAEAMSGSAVSLTIKLEEENKVSGWSGIFVHAVDGAASLSISGTGSLTAEGTGGGSFSGIQVQSNDGKAELTINNVDVTATNNVAQGIILRSGGSSTASLTVNGGELTASGSDAGIKYVFGSSGTGDGTPTVTVSNNAIVRANGGISDDSSTDIQIGADSSASSGGIVFDGKNGTVYGDVTLQEDLEIGEGESLTIGDGASLNTGSHEVIVNGGILTGRDKITGTVKYAPTITTTNLPNGTVGTSYNHTLAATGSDTITWSVSNGSLPYGLTLNKDTGEIFGTPTTAGSYKFTIKAENNYGSASKELTIDIGTTPIYSVSVTPAKIGLPPVTEGYDPQEPKTITIKNTGNQTILLEDYGNDPWLIITLDQNALKPNEEAKVSIKLKDGLSAETRSTLKGFITYTSEDESYRDHAHFEVTYEVRHDMKHVDAKEPTHLEEGNIAYWYCEYCDKYYKDGAGANELSLEDITIPKLKDQTATGTPSDNDKPSGDQTGDTTSTETGDDSNIAIWIAVMLTAGTAMTGTVLYGRRKKHSR